MTATVSRRVLALAAVVMIQFVTVIVLPDESTAADPVVLETIRGGYHTRYSSIVFEFDRRAVVEKPVVGEKEIFFVLRNVTTTLASFRGYKTFDSWVVLEDSGNDLNVRIGLPVNFKRHTYSQIENPPRLVVKLYEEQTEPPPPTEKKQALPSKKAASPPMAEKALTSPTLPIKVKIRGGRHRFFSSVVFEYEQGITFEDPVLGRKELSLVIKDVTSKQAIFRGNEKYGSWVVLEDSGNDLGVRIGLPKDFVRFSQFHLTDPSRYVINLYQQEKPTPSLPKKKDTDVEILAKPSEEKRMPSAPTEKKAATPDPSPAKTVKEAIPPVKRPPVEKADVAQEPVMTPVLPPRTEEISPVEEKSEAEELPPPEDLFTLNFYQSDIRELLSALAMQRELNIVLSQEVIGDVSVQLYRMTLTQALDAITLAGGFSYTNYGDVYYFFKPKEARDPQAGRLKMRIFRLKYAAVDKIQEILDAISGMRMIKIHEPSKTLIVEDTPENIEKIETLLNYWDAKPKQVLIEAKILEVTLTDDMSLGVDWQKMLGDGAVGTAGFSRVAVPTTPGVTPVAGGEGAAFVGSIITGAGSVTQFAAALNALRSKTKVNTLSTPKILAIHGEQATVQVGGQQGYPVSTTSEGVLQQSVQFIPTGTTLSITPWIDDDGNVLLDVRPEISSVTLSSTGIPTVKTTNVSTWLLARSGQTVFMGGLIQDTTSSTRETVPCLGSLPGLGALFGRSVQTGSKTELVVLITPRIIATENYEDQLYKRKAEEREREMGGDRERSAADLLKLLRPSK